MSGRSRWVERRLSDESSPLSTVWLCKMDREVKAKKAMRRLIGNVEGYDIDHEYLVMKQHLAESQALMEKSSKLGWVACFKGTNLRRTLISTIPFSMQASADEAYIASWTIVWLTVLVHHRISLVARLSSVTLVSNLFLGSRMHTQSDGDSFA